VDLGKVDRLARDDLYADPARKVALERSGRTLHGVRRNAIAERGERGAQAAILAIFHFDGVELAAARDAITGEDRQLRRLGAGQQLRCLEPPLLPREQRIELRLLECRVLWRQ